MQGPMPAPSTRMSALTTYTETNELSVTRIARSDRVGLIARVVALTVLISAAAVYEAAHVSAVSAPEVWVHLRTGVWILQNHSIPHTGLFSQTPILAWDDSTWGFDVVLAGIYRLFGLRGIPILLILLKLTFALVTYLLARAGRANFWGAVLLSTVAQYVIAGLQPLPYVFSILFFASEFLLLLRARLAGQSRSLFWMPPVFVLWANTHIQFIAGLIALVLFLVATWIERMLRDFGFCWIDDRIAQVRLQTIGIATGLSFLATLFTPYTFHLLPRAFRVLYSAVGFEHFSEMTSMSFRRPQEYMLMLLVMAAFLALGRRRSLALFEVLTLIAGMLVAFRIQRDAWLVVLPAIAVLSRGFRFEQKEKQAPSSLSQSSARWAAASLSLVIVAIAAMFLPGPQPLMAKVSEDFPVKACDYIREKRLPQPLFNAYIWGSFLTWYLPEYPVSVDSRIELYGNDRLAAYFDVVGGTKRLEEEPTVARAGTLLIERQSAMSKALMTLPGLKSQYQLVYSDDIASVFVPHSTHEESYSVGRTPQ
jgi:hypothetical protein